MATFTVINTEDSGLGSLRQAIEDANATDGLDTIEFDEELREQKITLISGELEITDDLTINGLGADSLTISGNNDSRVFLLDDSDESNQISVVLNGLTITEGNVPDNGGGIFNRENLTVNNSTIFGNSSINGGGISNEYEGTVVVTNSSITDNFVHSLGNGGGIFNENGTVNISDRSNISHNTADGDAGGISSYFGVLTIDNSTIAGNSSGNGGGIDSRYGTLTINNSTISDNTANYDGGAINDSGILIVSNSTFSGNSGDNGGAIWNESEFRLSNSTIFGNSANFGGGISNDFGGMVEVTHSTISDNIAYDEGGGGIFNRDGTVELQNTIVANNSGPNPDVEGNFISNGYNLIGNGTGSTGFNSPGDLVGTSDNPIDPLLDSLKNNGGSTETQALLPGSPAIDSGDPEFPDLVASNPIVLYQFNDPNNLGFDTSGNNNEATNFGATFTESGFQQGAAFFDDGTFLRSPVDVNPSVLPQLTWGAWVRPNAIGTDSDRAVLSADNQGWDRDIHLRPGPEWVAYNGNEFISSEVTPSASKWTFLAATYNQSDNTMTFYVDGESIAGNSSFGPSFPFFDIGNTSIFPAEFFIGAIDNVFVYDEVLSANQIASIRANGFPPLFDQRGEGFERILDGDADGIATIDIGAYELAGEPSVEIIGTEEDDLLTGSNGADQISGLGGNDILQGLAGNDQISGGSDNDLIAAGRGNDTVTGDGGEDNILGGEGDDLLDGGAGDDIILGESEDDTINGDTGNDIIDGGEGSDSVSGGGESDLLDGGSGADSLSGDLGTDTLTGGLGNDFLDGGAGNDRLIGVDSDNPDLDLRFGAGEVDTLTGAAGQDTFVLGDENRVYYDDGDSLSRGESDFAAIADFNSNEDLIQLNGSADLYCLDLFTSESGTIDADLIYDPGVSTRGEVIATLQDVSPDLSISDPSFVFV